MTAVAEGSSARVRPVTDQHQHATAQEDKLKDGIY